LLYRTPASVNRFLHTGTHSCSSGHFEATVDCTGSLVRAVTGADFADLTHVRSLCAHVRVDCTGIRSKAILTRPLSLETRHWQSRSWCWAKTTPALRRATTTLASCECRSLCHFLCVVLFRWLLLAIPMRLHDMSPVYLKSGMRVITHLLGSCPSPVSQVR
jgi:hypothetical protein